MSILSSKFATPIRYEVVFNISKDEYQKWTDRLLDQILSRVEVPGYRPGKAPKEKLLANSNPERVAQIIFQETIDKFAPEAVKEANEKIVEQNPDHVVLNHNVDQDSTVSDDKGFTFTLITTLLPVVDLTALEDLKLKKPDDKELNLPAKEEFHTQEIGKFLYYFNTYSETDQTSTAGSKMIVNLKGLIEGEHREDLGGPNQEVVLGFGRYLPDFEAGLSGLKKGDKKEFKVKFPKDYFVEEIRGKVADFEAEILELKQAKYLKIEDLVANSENPSFRSLVPDMETLEKDIAQSYETNKEQIRTQKYRNNVIKAIIDTVPDFDLPKEDVVKEFDRIKNNVERLAEENKISKAEVIKANGIPFEKEPKTDKEIEKVIQEYVNKEFKLSLTLNYIYLRRITTIDRVTESQIDEVASAMVNKPSEYGVPEGITKEQAIREANDRLVRNIGLDWVIKKVSA
jgi:trigger factor